MMANPNGRAFDLFCRKAENHPNKLSEVHARNALYRFSRPEW
jgi:hypothetical protein